MKAVLLSLALGTGAGAKTLKPERWYQERVAALMKGKMEARVDDGRVDVLTGTHAIEVEFASKWKQAIGQVLWYSMQTNRKAAIVLILEDAKRDRADAIRLGSVIDAKKLPIQVWLWPDDFTGEVSK